MYNFHCAGKQFITPLNAELPSKQKKISYVKDLLKEIAREAHFPDEMDMGTSGDTIGIRAGGSCGDWIANEFSIPTAEVELGGWTDYTDQWLPIDPLHLVTENLPWVEYTYQKVGNHISV